MDHPHPRDNPPRLSPTLPSLDFLQSQRRGSVTDPALHAAHSSAALKQQSSSYRHPADQQSTSSFSSDFHSKTYMPDVRPSSPYVFGDATVHTNEHPAHLRKILRNSPPLEHPSQRATGSLSHDAHEPSRTRSGSSITNDSGQNGADKDRLPFIGRRTTTRDPPTFDFNMRRHSIAVGQGQNSLTLPNLSSTLHGTKRKMSDDRGVFPPVGEDVDPQLVGPGVPSIMDIDADAPAPKRRGSTIDTQRIAQLSLNDRRNSVDSRGSHWIHNERRESAPSLFPSVPGISSFNNLGPDSLNGRPPSGLNSFAWPANSHHNDVSSSSSLQNESTNKSRAFDPVHQINLAPPSSYAVDRRMSVPDITNPPPRTLRSQSRPPSRQTTGDANSQPSSGQEEQAGPSVGNGTRPNGISPYSRSPELRVTHKLAERKRRSEMRGLFDELRDQLPADRGMKASKWEILSKAIDYVAQLKRSHQEMAQEIDMLRAQLRQTQGHGAAPEGMNSFGHGGPSSGQSGYNHAPSMAPYNQLPSIHQTVAQVDSRSTPSSQGAYSQSANSHPSQNGNGRGDPHP